MDQVQLATFQAVIAEGSFDAAARALHVTPPAVSQRIKALEQAVGQVLVRRTKPALPTAAGETLVRLAGQIALLEREALDAVRGSTRTKIAVSVNADSLHSWFLPALARLPELAFDLHQEDEDYTTDLLRAGTVMAAVTTQQVSVQGCRVERLGAMRYLGVAAPETFTGFATTPMVLFNRKDQLQHRFRAAVTHRTLDDPPIHYVPAAAAFGEAIRMGLGWGMVPEPLAGAGIAVGSLVEIAPGHHLDVPLHWQCWRMESTALTALTGAVREAAARALRP
jgi:LysR family transcriptional regulator, chromosome initiation inhibitor